MVKFYELVHTTSFTSMQYNSSYFSGMVPGFVETKKQKENSDIQRGYIFLQRSQFIRDIFFTDVLGKHGKTTYIMQL